MSGFGEAQIKELKGKLSARHVHTRQANGLELSYVEGWFTIAEANRIFGFDGWDRETLETNCVWQGRSGGTAACSYIARVRITVHLGEKCITREGSGFGTGSGTTPGEAHEKALKEAETDAMKRALVTFGNRFGLALYDREQRGVTRSQKEPIPSEPWPVRIPGADSTTLCPSPHEFYAELRKHLEGLQTTTDVQALWRLNEPALKTIRERHRELVDRTGTHYTAVFARLCRARAQQLETSEASTTAPPMETMASSPARASASSSGIDKSVLTIGAPKRTRDKGHRRFVAAQPCLICGRMPTQAHHLTFAQPRARSLKTSDEWTVPLCVTHHRELHDRGNERAYWAGYRINPEPAAQDLWARSRAGELPDERGLVLRE
ncbi:MAG: DNA recombination protein Rad52 [Alphaproteobacteria bacterium]|jgi:DNA recombination protein Rad52